MSILHPLRRNIVKARNQRMHQGRQIVGKAGDLIAEDGDQDQQPTVDRMRMLSRRIEAVADQARQAKALQRVRHGIEEIGEYQTRDKGQQDRTEQPQQQNHCEKRRDPEVTCLCSVMGGHS